ncbi:MAG: LysM peptidoglycan-binding domain-containing protein [Caldilineaceae bacterium]
MCGFDLRRDGNRRRSISWIDGLLVLAVLAVLIFWWQAGSRQDQPATPEESAAVGIPPEQIPFLPPTPTATPMPVPAVAAPGEEPAPVLPTGTVEHSVTAGETLLSIALDYGVTVEEIRAANNLTGELIRIGDKLMIPNQQAIVAPVVGETPRGPVSNFDYVVQDGDTIVSIASRLGSTVDEIVRVNGLGSDALIRPGQTLSIPVRQVPQEVIQSGAAGAAGDAAPWPAPQVTAPADGATLPRTEPVLLRWVSVGMLAPNEWYVVLLYPQSPNARQYPSIWTKATSHRLELEEAPAPGQSASYSWQVSVVRVEAAEEGSNKLEPVSPSSELRSFSWQ